MTDPLVSVIITTRNSEKTLKALLQSIKEQSYIAVEIIVVDNNSTDKTVKIGRAFTKKVFNRGPERSAQRNFGAKKALGKYLLVLDSDMILTKDVIRECVEQLEKSFSHQAIIIPERSFGEGFWAKTKAWEREINQGEDYFEAARFFPKELFLKLGGYDEELTGPEDWDLPQRLSKEYPPGRIKSFILHNEDCPTLIKLAKRKYYYGLSAHKYLKKQQIFPLNQKTVYFLRPAFYRQWKKIIFHPVISFGMMVMLLAETIGGGLGYLIGRLKDE
ncbi:MAG: putative beta-1,3-galactosyltransferase [Candidatus Daviesbacteria bacterium GW2011_GWA1_41_61]|uniref:Putative beta-1,3-galactosyltransferase n=1 Tax=Candidatus Daviesbacteria bacterium GW2011_GWA2_40_9 TaxID=1618424 RepID=A0A0G0X5Z3_9BACT|nr:MAG: beta-1,3-galactosyltransferase [Candidatus Daviesbacteria bacterium GW2011_GWC1_40_9]KKR83062.1 MAG: putative beta-1,3-galactosyltransferase [Candidatus Daviesbacteria bacterium GW2011_GWA2_40_9]KKR92986.1 MAG: putative beta-1,3-galactosyltransferase [Candidatus Daviesbacteria bacterium GW2011_GWB1_41_15]KKS15530.1 MAG: putative beta-1,3-galactosyltransferase [Candidatus Daviesbacteria bacterium GW2011_GWA1_41_61]